MSVIFAASSNESACQPRGTVLRFLEEKSLSSSDDDELLQPYDAQVLRDTFLVYGIALVCILTTFYIVRNRFPRPYTLRRWVEDLKCIRKTSDPPIPEDQGFFKMLLSLCRMNDSQIIDECGLDAFCFLRILSMGMKISAIGATLALFLCPLYATVNESEETAYITDGILKITITHVPASSSRLIATALAAYILFGSTMVLILEEFKIFTSHRHHYLKRLKPKNFSVYIRNIPLQFKDNATLKRHLAGTYPSVQQVLLCAKTPTLKKLVARRESLVSKIEHNEALIKLGFIRNKTRLTEDTDSLVNDLHELNRDISSRILAITNFLGDSSPAGTNAASLERSSSDQDEQFDNNSLSNHVETPTTESTNSISIESGIDEAVTEERRFTFNRFASQAADSAVGSLVAATTTVAAMGGPVDGSYYPTGFVTFSKLRDVHNILQMVQHEKPFCMEILEAPHPNEIFWPNVGRTHKDLQLGLLLSTFATVALCFLWTIPMAFLASLSSVGALKEQFQFIADLLSTAPFMESVFELLAPLLVSAVNAVLPTILEFLSMFEGPISEAEVSASLFSKLSYFMIIQTFFVSAISGGIVSELTNILNNPTSVVDLLANSLPAQATYFIQIVFISTVVTTGSEVLRVVPIAQATLRKFIGPRLTEKERNKVFMGLRPLSDPEELDQAEALSQVVLYFTVQLVYAVIAPITAFILGFCFACFGLVYRHQFVYIYPVKPDSGGKLWTRFIRILLVSMLIAETTIMGLLALKKAAAALPLMAPLIIITALFSLYIHQQHFRVATYLPASQCSYFDVDQSSVLVTSLLKDAYLQPELCEKTLWPEGGTRTDPGLMGNPKYEMDEATESVSVEKGLLL